RTPSRGSITIATKSRNPRLHLRPEHKQRSRSEQPVLLGSINHVSITVSDLREAMKFFGPMLEFLDYTVGKIEHYRPAGTELTVNINEANDTAFNVWQPKP